MATSTKNATPRTQRPGSRSRSPSRSLRTLHLTAEYWPYIRTGGLGEAVHGMATFQAKMGSRTSVLLPLYSRIRDGGYRLEPVGGVFEVRTGDRVDPARLWRAKDAGDGPEVFLIENEHFFGRPGVYGADGEDYSDNHLRFSFFSSAAIAALSRLAPAPEPLILHMHDWHTALAVIYLRTLMRGDPEAERVATVLSVHNGGFQGHFPPEAMAEMGLPSDLYHMDFMEWYGRANVLKGGLLCTDMATTVSPGHAFELRTAAGGFGLHDTFLGLHDRLVGVLNGIDVSIWDPEKDPAIAHPYSAEDLSGKALCKRALQDEFGLGGDPDKLLVGMVARMVAQKGLDLILGGRAIRESDAQFVFLGSGEKRYEEGLRNLAAAHPERIAVELEFSEEREHRIMAGGDALLMPSLYEPCGLTQMRAMRYGTIPLARRVGGLANTIEDGHTGLLFDDYIPERLDWLIDRAIARFRKPGTWKSTMLHAMDQDFSWERVADRYYEIYDQALEVRAESAAG